VLNLVALAEGGAQDPDRIGAVSLDFEMNGPVGLQGGYTEPNTIKYCQAANAILYGYICKMLKCSDRLIPLSEMTIPAQRWGVKRV